MNAQFGSSALLFPALILLIDMLSPSYLVSQELLVEKWQFVENRDYILGPRIERSGDGSLIVGDSYFIDSAVYRTNSEGETVFWYQRSDFDPVLRGITPDGRVEWTYRSDTTNDERLVWLCSTAGGELYYIAYTQPATNDPFTRPPRPRQVIGDADLLLGKLDAQHGKVWEKVYGGEARERLQSAVLNDRQELFVSGGSESSTGLIAENSGGVDMWVLKLDSAGEVLWSVTMGGSGWDMAYGVVPLPDGGCAVYGESFSSDGDFPENRAGMDAWIIRLDNRGDILWKRRFGGNGRDSFLDGVMFQNNIVLTGSCTSTDVHENDPTRHNWDDYWLVVLDPDGEVLLDRFYGGWGNEFSVRIEATANHLFLGGYTTTQMEDPDHGDVYVPKPKPHTASLKDWWIVELDSTFTIVGSVVYGGSYNEEVTTMAAWDNEITVSGETLSDDGDVKNSTAAPDGKNNSVWFVTFLSATLPSGIEQEAEQTTLRYDPEDHSITFGSSCREIDVDHIMVVGTKGDVLPCTVQQSSPNQVRIITDPHCSGPVFLHWRPEHGEPNTFKLFLF